RCRVSGSYGQAASRKSFPASQSTGTRQFAKAAVRDWASEMQDAECTMESVRRKMNSRRVRAFCIVHFALTLALCSCGRRPPLLPVTLPDLSRVDPGVQAQVRGRYDTLNRAMSGSSTELASAYGQYGMVLQAAEYFDAAEPCYLNAQALAPNEMRWP